MPWVLRVLEFCYTIFIEIIIILKTEFDFLKVLNRYTYKIQSSIPLNTISPSALFRACKRVLITSNGLTASAANDPAAQPDANEMKNAASPEPSFFRGPNWFSVANNGKYTTENETSRAIVAPMPLYSPSTPFSRNNVRAIFVAEVFGMVFPADFA